MEMFKWGTWEELLLGGAVLRHGTRAWDAVASELRARVLFPYCFTPEVCKAKYEDLQDRFCGCTAWFEELRKQRVAELKRELERSEDSIGSLESKLSSLQAEKEEDGHVEYDSSRTVSLSLVPNGNSDGIEFSGKENSKDGLSASSYAEETRTNWSPDCQIPVGKSTAGTEIKPEVSDDSVREKTASDKNLQEDVNGDCRKVSVRKRRRGKRKRKDCNKEVKEVSAGESDMLSSAMNIVEVEAIRDNKEESTGDCDRSARSSEVDDQNGRFFVDRGDDLIGILNSIMAKDDVTVFCRLKDSQKRARYKKTIRRHLDLETIRSRIFDRSIKSERELVRDLLLMANNALVFYSKESREYKSALSLRDMAKEIISQRKRKRDDPGRNAAVKPRSVRPCNRVKAKKMGDSVKVVVENLLPEEDKACDADYATEVQVVPVVKRSVGRPVRTDGRKSGRKRTETPARGRKRPRVK